MTRSLTSIWRTMNAAMKGLRPVNLKLNNTVVDINLNLEWGIEVQGIKVGSLVWDPV